MRPLISGSDGENCLRSLRNNILTQRSQTCSFTASSISPATSTPRLPPRRSNGNLPRYNRFGISVDNRNLISPITTGFEVNNDDPLSSTNATDSTLAASTTSKENVSPQMGLILSYTSLVLAQEGPSSRPQEPPR